MNTLIGPGPSGESLRVLLVGDVHGNTSAAIEVIDHAVSLRAGLVLQVGDWGYWDDQGQQTFQRKVERRLAAYGVDLWWIRGNHEDQQRLAAQPVDADGRRQLSEHVWNLPDGYRWAWDGTVWLAVGGAVSVDKLLRTEGKNWFASEELTDEQASRIIADGPADVVISHDAPLGVPFLRRFLRQDLPAWRRQSPWPTGAVIRSDEHQRRIRQVVEGVGAGRLFHGHHHIRYSDTLAAVHGPVAIEGLGMDTDPLSARCLLVDGSGRPLALS